MNKNINLKFFICSLPQSNCMLGGIYVELSNSPTEIYANEIIGIKRVSLKPQTLSQRE